MLGYQIEMLLADPAPLVYVPHAGPGVEVGAAEHGGEELDLLGCEPVPLE